MGRPVIVFECMVFKAGLKTFLILLNLVAPHITEEMWSELGFGGMVSGQKWPEWDENKTVEDVIEIPVQINGKVRGKVQFLLMLTRML